MTDPLDDHQHANVRQAYEDALDAVPAPVRDRHATLAEMVREMADWPGKAIEALEDLHAAWDGPTDDYNSGGWDAINDALREVRNVGA